MRKRKKKIPDIEIVGCALYIEKDDVSESELESLCKMAKTALDDLIEQRNDPHNWLKKYLTKRAKNHQIQAKG